MKAPLSWLRTFVPDLPSDPQPIADAFTMGGLPCENIETLPNGDKVLDVEVTSNRADCLSIVGCAREIAALMNLKFVTPLARTFDSAAGQRSVSVSIEAPDTCPYYSARILRGLKVAPSPKWLADRLEAVGVRPINNVVDVTNYVLFETGQPLHAFDFAKVAGSKIIVRFAKPGETLLTLDGKEQKPTPTMLVIADASKPSALAGVMGGEISGVTNATVDVLLESARFEPLTIRRTARALAMASDSSYRFERGLDPTLAKRASDRACELLLDLAGGRVDGPLVDAGEPVPPPTKASVRIAHLRELLGVDWSAAQAREALVRLGFAIVDDASHAARHAAGDPSLASVLQNAGLPQTGIPQHGDAKSAGAPPRAGEVIHVVVPSHRLDVKIEVDLIEEIARVIGYDHIPTRDSVAVRLTQREPARIATAILGQSLNAAGYFEALTFSFVSDALADSFRHADAARLHKVNSATRRVDAQLRPSVLPNLLEAVRHNETVGTMNAKLFETASVFWLDAKGQSVERRALSIVGDDDYRELRGAIEAALNRLDAKRRVTVKPATRAGFGSAACGEVFWNGESVGYIGKVDRAIADKLGLRGLPAIAELWLDTLIAGYQAVPQLVPLPTFPAVRRDLSLLVTDDVRYESIEKIVHELKLDALEAVDFVTTYKGKPLDKGTKSVTFTLAFRKPDGTLTSGEVDERVGKVVDVAKTKLGATLRT
jgi:phenylalanyl-tRNA synthetase beta chain